MRLKPKRASTRNVLQSENGRLSTNSDEHRGADDERAVPGLRKLRASPERIDQRDATAEREGEAQNGVRHGVEPPERARATV